MLFIGHLYAIHWSSVAVSSDVLFMFDISFGTKEWLVFPLLSSTAGDVAPTAGAAPVPDCGEAVPRTEKTDGCFAVAFILIGVALEACPDAGVFPLRIDGGVEDECFPPVTIKALSFTAELFPGGVFECTLLEAAFLGLNLEVVVPDKGIEAFFCATPCPGEEGFLDGARLPKEVTAAKPLPPGRPF